MPTNKFPPLNIPATWDKTWIDKWRPLHIFLYEDNLAHRGDNYLRQLNTHYKNFIPIYTKMLPCKNPEASFAVDGTPMMYVFKERLEESLYKIEGYLEFELHPDQSPYAIVPLDFLSNSDSQLDKYAPKFKAEIKEALKPFIYPAIQYVFA